MESLDNIIIPGQGLYDLRPARINSAVKEYDERLRFGFNEKNGDWIVYIVMPRDFDSYYHIGGEPVYPVLGVGREVPDSPDSIIERIKASDSMRHGDRILRELNKANERLRAAQDAEISEKVGEAAEHIEHHLRTSGETDKYTKSFRKVK